MFTQEINSNKAGILFQNEKHKLVHMHEKLN